MTEPGPSSKTDLKSLLAQEGFRRPGQVSLPERKRGNGARLRTKRGPCSEASKADGRSKAVHRFLSLLPAEASKHTATHEVYRCFLCRLGMFGATGFPWTLLEYESLGSTRQDKGMRWTCLHSR